MITIQNISRKFSGVQALKSISLHVKKGELHGLIGPDGSGKTTLFRILTTLIFPDDGKASIGDWDVVEDYKKIRTMIGYMPGRFSLYQDLTVEENLKFFAAVFQVRVKDSYELIRPIYSQIEPFKNRRAGALSGGMKQKLALSCALIHKPDVLLLDEPTTGVDAVSRREFWDMLNHLIDLGLTILVSTPYMDEAARCHRISLIHKGRIFKTDFPDEAVRDFEGELFSLRTPDRLKILNSLRELPSVVHAYPNGQDIHFRTDKNISLQQMEDQLFQIHIPYYALQSIKPSIEDYFMQRLGRNEY